MFINTQTGEILTYAQLRALPEFSGVGWPSDPTLTGVSEAIAPAYARLIETVAPVAGQFEVAYVAGGEMLGDGWYAVWTVRNMTGEEIAAAAAAIVAEYESAVQQHLDTAAATQGYDNIVTAVSYADEPAVPKFQEDGQAFRAWRSLCWAYCYEQLAAVQAGQRPQPTVEELIGELPLLVLPGA